MQTIYWNLQADNETEILKAAGCLLRQGEVLLFLRKLCMVWVLTD